VPVRRMAAAVHHNVLQPLDVRLRVAEHAAHEVHVASDHSRLIGRQPGLQERPVGGPLCRGQGPQGQGEPAEGPDLQLEVLIRYVFSEPGRSLRVSEGL